MFLLRIGESLDIKTDSFNKSLKLLLSGHRIVKLLKSLSWLCSKIRSEIAGGFHSTLFPVKCDMLELLTRYSAKMVLSFTKVSNVAVTQRKLRTFFGT